MNKKLKKYLVVLFIFVFIILWIVILYNFPPEKIVEKIGIENGYIVAFLVALFGGVTSLTGSSYYIVIATLAAGGLSPLALGLVGGIGATISDSVFFLFGKKASEALIEDKKEKIKKLTKWLKKKSKFLISLISFVYIGLSPFPNDVLMLALGILGYKYKALLPIIFLGEVTATIIASYLGSSLLGILF